MKIFLKNILLILSNTLRRIYFKNKLKSNKPEIFILGNQKSGTSAVAKLLSECINYSCSLDIKEITPVIEDLLGDKISLNNFVNKYPWCFTYKIVKEPSLTGLYNKIVKNFPNAKYVFVVRHPMDNIRSILDRVNVSPLILPREIKKNYLKQIKNRRINKAWNDVLRSDTYVKGRSTQIPYTLAYRWKEMVNIYLKNKDDFVLVKYEDFKNDKQKCIEELAKKLGYKPKKNISNKMDIQFQPKGKNQRKGILGLFPKGVVKKVEIICGEEMKNLNYKYYSK